MGEQMESRGSSAPPKIYIYIYIYIYQKKQAQKEKGPRTDKYNRTEYVGTINK
jgi:hypothetical protein